MCFRVMSSSKLPLRIVGDWEEYFDPGSDRCYYVNCLTKKRVKEKPGAVLKCDSMTSSLHMYVVL